MNSFVALLCLVAVASASHHIPSGSISVGHNGAVIAGPAGSVHTDNGLHGHGAGARISGPAGDVRTRGGHVELAGPGLGHHGHAVVVPVVHHVAPVHHVAVVHGHHGIAHGLVGHGGIGHGLVGLGHHGW